MKPTIVPSTASAVCRALGIHFNKGGREKGHATARLKRTLGVAARMTGRGFELRRQPFGSGDRSHTSLARDDLQLLREWLTTDEGRLALELLNSEQVNARAIPTEVRRRLARDSGLQRTRTSAPESPARAAA